MKNILILQSDLTTTHKKMMDNAGRLDLMGQIMSTGYSIDVRDHMRTPADTMHCIYPFTFMIRGMIQNSELSIQIMKNSSTLSPRKQVEEARELLAEYDIHLEVVDD